MFKPNWFISKINIFKNAQEWEKQEFGNAFQKMIDLSTRGIQAPLEVLNELCPKNILAIAIANRYKITAKVRSLLKEKNVNIKKSREYSQLFLWFGRDLRRNPLSREEILEYYSPLERESNSEWDFIAEEDKLLIEITDTCLPGKLVGPIQKEYNTQKIPWFEHSETFDEAKKVILKKLAKSTNFPDFFHRIIISINAFDEQSSESMFMASVSRDGEYIKPEMYRSILRKFAQSNYCNFKNGELIFVYDWAHNKNEIFTISNYMLNTKSEIINNDGALFVTKQHFGEEELLSDPNYKFHEEWKIYLQRIFKQAKRK